MDFRLADEHERLRRRCLELASDFAPRSAEHDREATHPTKNYERLREEGFLALSVPKEWGGAAGENLCARSATRRYDRRVV